MRILTLVAAVAFVGTAFAGCVETIPGGNQTAGGLLGNAAFTLSRQVEILANKENVERASQGRDFTPEALASTVFVVGVRNGTVNAADLVVRYVDRSGSARERALSEFGLPVLTPGATVRVGDAGLASNAVLLYKGEEVARRDRPTENWWKTAGYPLGFSLEPGAVLAWAVTGEGKEEITLKNVRPREEPVVVDRIRGSISAAATGSVEFRYTGAPETIQANARHTARPLDVTASLNLRVPILAEIAGHHAVSAEALEAGFEAGPTLDARALGRLWIAPGGEPVRSELREGHVRGDGKAIAWLAGDVEGLETGNFSCLGKTRADACEPTEIPWDELRIDETASPEAEDLDARSEPVDVKALKYLTAFLGEDLRPDDRLSFRAVGTEDDLGGGPLRHAELTMEIRAMQWETVTVRAGTFRALKVVESIRVKTEVDRVEDDGEVRFGGVQVDERLVESTLWLMEGSFLPVRVERSLPIDLSAVTKDVVRSVRDAGWDDSPFFPLRADDVDFVVQGKMTVELTKHEGSSRIAPWLVLSAFNTFTGFAPALGAAGALGGPDPDCGPYGCEPECPPGAPGCADRCYEGAFPCDHECEPYAGCENPGAPAYIGGTFTRNSYYGSEEYVFDFDGSVVWKFDDGEGVRNMTGRYSTQRGTITFPDGTERRLRWLHHDEIEVNDLRFERLLEPSVAVKRVDGYASGGRLHSINLTLELRPNGQHVDLSHLHLVGFDGATAAFSYHVGEDPATGSDWKIIGRDSYGLHWTTTGDGSSRTPFGPWDLRPGDVVRLHLRLPNALEAGRAFDLTVSTPDGGKLAAGFVVPALTGAGEVALR